VAEHGSEVDDRVVAVEERWSIPDPTVNGLSTNRRVTAEAPPTGRKLSPPPNLVITRPDLALSTIANSCPRIQAACPHADYAGVTNVDLRITPG
jgi:hypothetical protein